MSICPKNKSSKGRRDKRRANWKMTAPNLVKCSKCGELMMPHRVCKACGSYNKKETRPQKTSSKVSRCPMTSADSMIGISAMWPASVPSPRAARQYCQRNTAPRDSRFPL
jgi:large subunit ribosomal protein L32